MINQKYKEYAKSLIEFEEPKIDSMDVTYSLTINAIISENTNIDNFATIRNQIINNVRFSNLIGSGIYVYPNERIHFSIINFVDLSSKNIDGQNNFRKRRQMQIDKIKSIFQQKITNIKPPRNKNVDLGYIYPKSSPSLAIQVFPNPELIKYFNDIIKQFSYDEFGKIEIKSNSTNNIITFPINVVRFFRDIDEQEYKQLKNNVDKFNNDSKKEIKYKINLTKINFVLSDNWLLNDKFNLGQYNIEDKLWVNYEIH